MVLFGGSKIKKSLQKQQTAQKKNYAWHAHAWQEVLPMIGTSEEGLTEAEVERRAEKFGLNRFSKQPAPSLLYKIFIQLKSPLAFVLVLAFIATVALSEYVDAGVIFFALSIAVIVGVLQEGKASRAFEKLVASQVHKATVIRDGKKHEILSEGLVPGDIVEILNGAQVPADVRLIHTKKLSVNEAALTGEWMAVKKSEQPVPVGTTFAERANMAWMGTFVAEGYAQGVVITTGDKTAIGELALNLNSIKDVETPLQREMAKISYVMLYIIVALVLGIFAFGVWQGQGIHEMLLTSIAIAVASVPEGLPAAVTIILAVGMEALLRRGGLVRNLLAAETLGSTTYVLTDKTGTLTQAKMAVTGVIQNQTVNLSPDSWTKNESIRRLLDVSLCATISFVDLTNGAETLRGNPVEKAILAAALGVGLSMEKGSLRSERIDVLAFTSENRFAAGLAETDGGFKLCINGAPEHLLEHAKYVYQDGKITKLTDEILQEYVMLLSEQTKAGKRLVGVSYKEVAYDDIPESGRETATLLKDSIFMGLVVLNDPVRKGVEKAIRGVKSAGAEVVLVTGDNPATALTIARQVGIAGPSEGVLTGDDIVELTDDELMTALESVHVFARVLPQQKLRLAQVLQQRGEVVAMTGDGINDAPALKKANIGIAIGSGTEVAKESSDLVLLKDSFETMYAAIEEGRRIISNLRKIVGYLLSTSLSEVVLIAAALAVGAPIPILPAQILWANVIEEGLMSVAFAFEGGEKDAMKRKPQDIREEGILSRQVFWFIAMVVTILSMITVSFYFYLRTLNLPIEELRSVMFLGIAVDSLFMAFAFRSLTTPFWRIPLRNNLFFVGSFLVSLVLLLIATTVPFMQYMLSYTPLPLTLVALPFLVGLIELAIIELAKWAFFERQK